ncbi:MAG: response regulator transcription factor, partial [Anaerolineae bacterium]|nr:response regulator transcription factor [Anaerolineae bacterium]
KRVAVPHTFYTATTPLSERELEVLRYITRGYSNKEIACELYITVRTVKHHIHNILRKLNLSRRQEAARYATERGWLLL